MRIGLARNNARLGKTLPMLESFAVRQRRVDPCLVPHAAGSLVAGYEAGKAGHEESSPGFRAGTRPAVTTRGAFELSTVAICGNSGGGSEGNPSPKPSLSCGGGGI